MTFLRHHLLFICVYLYKERALPSIHQIIKIYAFELISFPISSLQYSLYADFMLYSTVLIILSCMLTAYIVHNSIITHGILYSHHFISHLSSSVTHCALSVENLYLSILLFQIPSTTLDTGEKIRK